MVRSFWGQKKKKKTFTHHDASSDPSSSSSSMPMDLQRLLSKGPLPWTLDVPVETSSGHASHGIPKSLNESGSTRVFFRGWLLLWGIHSPKLDGFPIWCAMVAMVWDKKCDLAPSKPMRQMYRLPVLEFSSRPRVGFQLSCVGHRPAPKTTVPIPDRHI